MKKQLTFYFIRHGRTVWNEQGLMQGSGDSPLTEEGIQSAVKTGQALQNVDFIAAYSSCLQRTIDTANYIIGDRNIPLFQHRGLNEHYFGSWEGTNVELIRPLPEFQQMINDPANPSFKDKTGNLIKWSGDFITLDPTKEQHVGVVFGAGIQRMTFETLWGWV